MYSVVLYKQRSASIGPIYYYLYKCSTLPRKFPSNLISLSGAFRIHSVHLLTDGLCLKWLGTYLALASTICALLHSTSMWYSSPTVLRLHRWHKRLCLGTFLYLPVTFGRRQLFVLNCTRALVTLLLVLVRYFSLPKVCLQWVEVAGWLALQVCSPALDKLVL